MYEAQNASAQNPSAYEEINGLVGAEATRTKCTGIATTARATRESDERGE